MSRVPSQSPDKTCKTLEDHVSSSRVWCVVQLFDGPSKDMLPSWLMSAACRMSLTRLSAFLSAGKHLAAPLHDATSKRKLTVVHLDQAILERRQVDIALFLGIQLLPQRLDPGIPLLSGLAIHSRMLLCYLGFMASPRRSQFSRVRRSREVR